MASISKVVAPWSTFYNEYKTKNLNCICLLGTQNSGKSTLCEIFNDVVANKKHEALKFEVGKVKQYVLPGIISSNSLKVETMKPIIYDIDAKVDNLPSKTIIDIPTFTLPPFNQSNKKMWSVLDAKVSFNYLINSVSTCCFALVIDEKYTRAPMDGTKSILINFIDSFLSHPKELLESTALIITKCPAGFKLDTCITRIEGCIKKIDDPNVKIIEQWFQNIRQRNAILVFNKFGNQEKSIRDQVKGIYKQLTKLVPYQVQLNKLKSFENLNQDLKEQIRKYVGGIYKCFGGLINLILQILDNIIKTEEHYQTQKNKLSQTLFGIIPQRVNKSEVTQLPSFFNIIIICHEINKRISGELNENTFSDLLKIFIKYQIITPEEDIYVGLKQRVDLYKDFYQNIKNIVNENQQKSLRQLIDEVNQVKKMNKVNQIIKDSFEEGRQKQFYQDLVALINYVVPEKNLQNHELLNVLINSNLELAAKLSKPKSILKFLEMQAQLSSWNKLQLVSNLLTKIAQVLISVNRVGFAVNLFNKCGNPFKGIQEMSKILNDKDIKKKFKLEDFKPYLQFLQDIGLYQKSYETCYFLGNIYDSSQQRKTFRALLQKKSSGPKISTIDSFSDKTIRGLEQSEVEKLKTLAQQLQKAIVK